MFFVHQEVVGCLSYSTAGFQFVFMYFLVSRLTGCFRHFFFQLFNTHPAHCQTANETTKKDSTAIAK